MDKLSSGELGVGLSYNGIEIINFGNMIQYITNPVVNSIYPLYELPGIRTNISITTPPNKPQKLASGLCYLYNISLIMNYSNASNTVLCNNFIYNDSLLSNKFVYSTVEFSFYNLDASLDEIVNYIINIKFENAFPILVSNIH